MPAREIPHPLWPTFLADFGLRHFCWKATLERKHSGGRCELIADNGCFLEELATGCVGGQRQIAIVLDSPFREYRTHVVSNPQRVRVAAANQDSLEIDAADGSTMIVRVRQPDPRA
ncbi:MAG: hypothetical protein LAN64_12175 [Acidobacteriia bacterium]|nr:hypothetical protein [Terriglobia bacterium]